LEQLEPESAAYNICRVSRIRGRLNISALEASINEIIDRHETLRSAFRLIDGRPVQVVERSRKIAIQVIHLPDIPKDRQEAEIERVIQAEANRPFDLSAGYLLRCIVLRIGDDDHVLLLTTHHAVSDAWSLGILTRELWTHYEAFSAGKPSPLQPLELQYSDYALWQREWLQGEVREAQFRYWKKRLDNLPMLDLPTDRQRKPRQNFRGARLPITLSENLTSTINEMSHRYGVTPFMTLLAAFEVLLYRYSGQEDFAVGSPIANRRRPEVEGLIGFFVNTLVLRADVSGNPSFSEFLSRVKEACVSADANQDLPFEKLVQELQPERDLGRNPFFQVIFALQNATQPFSGISGLKFEPIELKASRSPFDLSLFLRERDGKYIGYIEYSTDLFDRDRIERMAGHFETLLEAIVADPDQSITTLEILTESERQQILIEWNDTAADYPEDKCIHQLFEAQAERTPDAIALEFEGIEITYCDLNRQANQLAHHLISLGIGPEKLVGICVERSIEMVVGLLGILKAGGAYVPLDPTYPAERLRFMLGDAQVSVLVTRQALIKNSGTRMEDGDPQSPILNPGLEIVCLDRDRPIIEKQSRANPSASISSANLAYAIYTSGSTGKPKGVLIEHRSVVNCLWSIGKEIALSESDIWLAVTTLAFDIAALELYLPLIRGAKLILASRDQSIDTAQLRTCIEASRPTVMQATPTLWKLLLETGWQRAPDLKILCGGEALSRSLADRLLAHGSSVWNLYGPTETAIWSTLHKVRTDDGPVLIGHPIANTRIYVLDAAMQPVPIGVDGDLYIAGHGVARSYLNRPQLSQERFLSDPFSDDPNARLYRTGDRVRYRSSGQLEFLGRADYQVKIRGHRIELGEIEIILTRHPSVKEVVIVARDRDSSEEKELAAYVVGSRETTPMVSELRSFLRERLPESMMPSSFVFVDALPLTTNGKIDRNALPPLDGKRPWLNHGFVEPRTEIEELVAQVWCDVLKLDKIGVHDNFFDLGGHSMLATQIISRMRDSTDKDLPLSTIFEAPTVAGLAATILRKSKNTSNEPPPIVRAPHDLPLPLSMNQEHLWGLELTIPGTHYFNVPCVYRLTGDLNVFALERALEHIIARHKVLRTVFAALNGRPVQLLKKFPALQLRVLDLRSGSPDQISQAAADLILQERQAPFDLSAGPLLRWKLLRLTVNEHLLLLTFHHIVCDQWSIRLIRSELEILYDALSQGRRWSLPRVAIHFSDYAYWESQSINGDFMKIQLEYWRKQLEEPLPKLQFGNKSEAKKRASFAVSHEPFELDNDPWRRIKSVAARETCTPFMVLVAALSVVLFSLSGENDIRIATLVANRRRPQTELTVGNFVNTVILRIRLAQQMAFSELLRHVRDITLAAYSHQELPFEQLAQVFEQERAIERSSLFQVLFMYQNVTPQKVEASGLAFAPLTARQLGIGRNLSLTDLDLVVDLAEQPTKFVGTLTYNIDSFEKKDVTELLKRLRRVLDTMTVAPEQNLTRAFFTEQV
jgi:amino acid adenylation domain-containing protein